MICFPFNSGANDFRLHVEQLLGITGFRIQLLAFAFLPEPTIIRSFLKPEASFIAKRVKRSVSLKFRVKTEDFSDRAEKLEFKILIANAAPEFMVAVFVIEIEF